MSKYSRNMPPDLKRAIGWLYDYIEPGKYFLDFGCSTGYFGSLIRDAKQCRVYGVEVSSDADQARKALDGVYSFDLDGTWPKSIYERKYNYLFFGDVLEHLKDPAAVLKKAKRLLREDGKIFVSIPNIAHISVRLELMRGGFEYEPMGILDSTHLKYFTLKTFVDMVNAVGYRVEHVDFSVNDYPYEMITKILKDSGLEPNKLFWDIVESKEARAYQYKFVLAPTDKKIEQAELLTAPLPDKPESQRDAYLEDLRLQAKLLHEHSKKQASIIDYYVAKSQSLEKELETCRPCNDYHDDCSAKDVGIIRVKRTIGNIMGDMKHGRNRNE
jgi:SAM-dependent methyltransferase